MDMTQKEDPSNPKSRKAQHLFNPSDSRVERIEKDTQERRNRHSFSEVEYQGAV